MVPRFEAFTRESDTPYHLKSKEDIMKKRTICLLLAMIMVLSIPRHD